MLNCRSYCKIQKHGRRVFQVTTRYIYVISVYVTGLCVVVEDAPRAHEHSETVMLLTGDIVSAASVGVRVVTIDLVLAEHGVKVKVATGKGHARSRLTRGAGWIEQSRA